MPSKIQLDENLWFLFVCLQKSDYKAIDFNAVGSATNLKPPAARMRYTRLRRQIEGGTLIGTHGTPFAGGAEKIAEAMRKRKRGSGGGGGKREGKRESESSSVEEEGEERERKRSGAASVKIEYDASMGSGEDSDSESDSEDDKPLLKTRGTRTRNQNVIGGENGEGRLEMEVDFGEDRSLISKVTTTGRNCGHHHLDRNEEIMKSGGNPAFTSSSITGSEEYSYSRQPGQQWGDREVRYEFVPVTGNTGSDVAVVEGGGKSWFSGGGGEG